MAEIDKIKYFKGLLSSFNPDNIQQNQVSKSNYTQNDLINMIQEALRAEDIENVNQQLLYINEHPDSLGIMCKLHNIVPADMSKESMLKIPTY